MANIKVFFWYDDNDADDTKVTTKTQLFLLTSCAKKTNSKIQSTFTLLSSLKCYRIQPSGKLGRERSQKKRRNTLFLFPGMKDCLQTKKDT